MAPQQFLHLLNSCSSLKQVFQVHAHIILSGLQQNLDLTETITQLCTWRFSQKNNPKSLVSVNHARSILKFAKNLNLSPWNDLIKFYATSNNDSAKEATWVFLEMRRLGIKPNEHTFPFIFKACALFVGVNVGRQIHGGVVKHGLLFNVYVQNSMIYFYGTCKKIEDACKVFDEMPDRTIVSWNSIIAAYVQKSQFYDSIGYFVKMRNSEFEPDETTMVLVLSACREIGSLSMGKWIHSQVIGNGIVVNCQLGTALVDMYAKCGALTYANLVFGLMVHRNVLTWSTIILGFAQHGFAKRALELFREMSDYSVKPNSVTFLGVLCACSHAGLVNEGKHYFKTMANVHGIKPTLVHFGTMVDLLGRAGLLEEAYGFILKMSLKADGAIWRSLLSACNIHDVHDETGIGKKVKQKLMELEPQRAGNFEMLVKNYAEIGLWDEAASLRSRMMDEGLKKKIAGESCLEISGSIF